MAATALRKEAESRGHEIVVEEQGGHKIQIRLSQDQIDLADIVIIAKAITISGKERLKNKKLLDVKVNLAVRNPKAIIDQAEELFNQAL